jgi:ribosomal protein S18 acetylase RimI-like enzyme
MASLSLPGTKAKKYNGLRPVSIRQDLLQIADLLEVSFTDMDYSGRMAVREMRTLAHSGPLLWLLQGMDRMIKALMQGFVWVEDEHIVGNVSISRAGFENTWIIANVAVHPDYRGHGIATALCQQALERISSWHGSAAVLQVEAQNPGAHHIYQKLGFYDERTFTRWRWRFSDHTPRPLENMPRITYRAPHEWHDEYELAELVRPQHMGGLGWLRPNNPSHFRPWFTNLFKPGRTEHWIVRGENNLDAAILTQAAFGSAYLRFDMLVHPHRQGYLEDALVNYILRCAAQQYRGALTEHPADDLQAEKVFRYHHFEAERTLIHMRWENPYL